MSTNEVERLRARVAELEADAERDGRATADVKRERDEQAARALRFAERLATLEATPPPHTVAALLAALEKLASKEHDRAERLVYPDGEEHEGAAEAYSEAARLITATLGAPPLLDRAVAEVCALPVEPGEAIDLWNSICVEVDTTNEGDGETRESFARIARMALAGMLACDATKGGAK